MHGGPLHAPHDAPYGRAALCAMGVTLALGAALVTAKAWAWVATGFSAAVLAAMLDGATDVAVSAMTLAAIAYARRPPDAQHRHGHGKAEGLSALAQCGLMAAAAAFLAWESVGRLLARPPVEAPLIAAAVIVGSSALTLAIIAVQRRAAVRDPSLALEADTAHYASDLALNAGVAATLIAAWVGAPPWLDGAFGLAVAVWVARAAAGVGRAALDMLLDAELPGDARARIEALAAGAHPQVRGVHDLRTRRAGAREAIALDIELDPSMTLAAAHAVGQAVEAAILSAFPRAEVMIHLDPHGVAHEDSRH